MSPINTLEVFLVDDVCALVSILNNQRLSFCFPALDVGEGT